MLNDNGFLIIKKGFKPEELLLESERSIKKAKEKKWKFCKVYHNIFLKNNINIFSLIFPHHQELNPNIFNCIKKLNLQNLIFKNTDWNYFKINQIELQHNEKYNYQSTWHRDWHNMNLENVVIILYLRDEKGFRLVDRKKNKKLIKNYPEFKEKNYKFGYMNIPKDYYHEFDVKAGDIVLFDAGLLHQGFAKGKRTHYFIRCQKSSKEFGKNFDEIIQDYLRPDVSLKKLEIVVKKDTYNYERNFFSIISRIKSIINLIIYYLPIIKFLKFIGDTKKKFTHFHYSFFQR